MASEVGYIPKDKHLSCCTMACYLTAAKFVELRVLGLLIFNRRHGSEIGFIPPRDHQRRFPSCTDKFELMAAAKEWNHAKRATVLPMFLWGKPVDIYIELSEETKADLWEMKKSLNKQSWVN